MSKIYVVVDVGCHECGVQSEEVGAFLSKEEAVEVSRKLFKKHGGWRDGGQTIPQVFEFEVPNTMNTKTTQTGVEEIVEDMMQMLYATNPNITAKELNQIISELTVRYTNKLMHFISQAKEEGASEERERILDIAEDFGIEKGEIEKELPHKTMKRFIEYIRWESNI